MRTYSYWIIFLCLVLGACKSDKESDSINLPNKEYRSFIGRSYKSAFNDLQDIHLEAARTNGVGPLTSRGDTISFMDQLIRIPLELETYKVDELTHSIPYLVTNAAMLLTDISVNFRDSLLCKDLPLYKLRVTSLTRTDEDTGRLSKRNANTTEESSHCFGTTFDIAWVRYDKISERDERELDDGQLKSVLGQVLFDLKERERCYIKHEVKQACFHITVR